ncbi:factor H binding protein domain-containing protein [Kingella negevensis]|uniref:factor H binding protein domain-containing protein n=1 Tax=Kingella negevensis TaxID=1522312 RepID=UPI0025507E81|nr:factor H binding protein domain-containing protein [Kingella negevensis]MDK4679212.1 factor H binding family protein [Kingella negevensis]MDK4683066.1 factor H binding family protein [Kingella negevensis]MDK4691266.1 factor H binding family protein [Kingella negevensis]MDK4693586.1 factor H binding family protein [Kingella negevensis]MDK4700402.1 factor H binding family protein [Kingella negevensis]
MGILALRDLQHFVVNVEKKLDKLGGIFNNCKSFILMTISFFLFIQELEVNMSKNIVLLAMAMATALSACGSSGGGSALSATNTTSSNLGVKTNNNNSSKTETTNENTTNTTKVTFSPVLDVAAIKTSMKEAADAAAKAELYRVPKTIVSSAESLTIDLIDTKNQTKTYLTDSNIELKDYLPKNEVTDVTMKIKHTLTYNGYDKEDKEVQDSYRRDLTQTVRAYNQDYSTVIGYDTTNDDFATFNSSKDASVKKVNKTSYSDKLMDTYDVVGSSIKTAALPTSGSYTYSGKAFTATDKDGVLSYTVDFDKKSGKGSITGIDTTGTITLEEGKIGSYTHKTTTSSGIGETQATTAKGIVGTYTVGFFGPNAEEVAGTANFKGLEHVGFGGKR